MFLQLLGEIFAISVQKNAMKLVLANALFVKGLVHSSLPFLEKKWLYQILSDKLFFLLYAILESLSLQNDLNINFGEHLVQGV